MQTSLQCIAVLLMATFVSGELDLATQGVAATHHHTPQIQKTLFVSLWDAAGRDLALRHIHKFTNIVICHYDVSVGEGRLQVKGLEPIDKAYLVRLRKAKPSLNILFRMYMLDGGQELFEFIGSDSGRLQKMAGEMIRLVRKHRMDGVYLDSAYNVPLSPSAPVASQYRVAAALTNRLTNQLKAIMQPHELLVIEVEPSYLPFVDLTSFKAINTSIISLTALDTPHPDNELKQTIEAASILKGMLKDKDLWIVVGLFSRRNGVGVRSGEGKENYLSRY